MSRKTSRVVEQAREARAHSAEIEKKIRELSQQISKPEKLLPPKTDDRTQSTLVKFRRYFRLEGAPVVKRPPTRAELRAHRNRTLCYIFFGLVILAWLFGKFSRIFLR